jgi:hypothetical protein
MSKPSDLSTVIVIILTVGLFVLALFVKGFTHDLLLEAGVFLVSVKLMLMAKKNAETESRLEEYLVQIKDLLADRQSPGLDKKTK